MIIEGHLESPFKSLLKPAANFSGARISTSADRRVMAGAGRAMAAIIGPKKRSWLRS